MSVSFVSLQNSRVYLQNNTFNLRTVAENLCDGLSKILQNGRFERCLFALRDQAPLNARSCSSRFRGVIASPINIETMEALNLERHKFWRRGNSMNIKRSRFFGILWLFLYQSLLLVPRTTSPFRKGVRDFLKQ